MQPTVLSCCTGVPLFVGLTFIRIWKKKRKVDTLRKRITELGLVHIQCNHQLLHGLDGEVPWSQSGVSLLKITEVGICKRTTDFSAIPIKKISSEMLPDPPSYSSTLCFLCKLSSAVSSVQTFLSPCSQCHRQTNLTRCSRCWNAFGSSATEWWDYSIAYVWVCECEPWTPAWQFSWDFQILTNKNTVYSCMLFTRAAMRLSAADTVDTQPGTH